jgi:hypothetical protein
MTLLLSGTNGLSDVDGSAATPAVRGTDANTGMFFPAADTIAFAEGGVEAMRLDANGRLALGATTILGSSNRASFTNDTSAKGVLALQSTSTSGYSAIELYDNSGSQQGAMGWGNASVAVTGAASATYLYSTGAITFLSGGTSERARITSGGDFLVGTTSVQQGGRFSISNTVNNVCAGMYASGTGNTTGTYLNCGDDFAIRFRVFTNGNVQNANNSYGSTSDIKLKENIVDATPKLEKLQQVRVVNYNLIGDTQKQIGVIAQELEQVFPGMVDESPDRDADGKDLGTTTKSVKYSVFVPMLIKAIQEQQIMIEQLKADVAALKGTV